MTTNAIRHYHDTEIHQMSLCKQKSPQVIVSQNTPLLTRNRITRRVLLNNVSAGISASSPRGFKRICLKLGLGLELGLRSFIRFRLSLGLC